MGEEQISLLIAIFRLAADTKWSSPGYLQLRQARFFVAFLATFFLATFFFATFLATFFLATFFFATFLATFFLATFFFATFLATFFLATFFFATFLATFFLATFFFATFLATFFLATFFFATFLATFFLATFFFATFFFLGTVNPPSKGFGQVVLFALQKKATYLAYPFTRPHIGIFSASRQFRLRLLMRSICDSKEDKFYLKLSIRGTPKRSILTEKNRILTIL